MRAGGDLSTNSVSPCEKVDPREVVGDKLVEESGGKEMEEESDEEDLGVETGEACEKVRVEKEGAVVKKLLDPKLPTQAVVDDHWVRGHVEYRNWCEVCVKARGKEWDHTKVGEKARALPEYSFDYCFPGDEMGYKWTVLVGRERRTKAWTASTIPAKGGMGRFVVDNVWSL